jgi:hypothetical protein
MLGIGDTAAMVAILSEDRTLEASFSAFVTHFKRPAIFKACCALVLLLEVSLPLPRSEKSKLFRDHFSRFLC